MFTAAGLSTALVVFFARMCDVGLGTIRHAMIIRGQRLMAFSVAFCEALIWVYAVSRVISSVSDPMTSLAFALGFASGTYVGITLEGFFKIGEQVVRVFTPYGTEVACSLRDAGFRVTVFDGQGRDGVVNLLFVQVRRRQAAKVAALAREVDPECYIVFDDIRGADTVRK
ncbi:DUF2179 domain-containing protein [Oleidesulfovibrio sp.]|uniref:DUF2179 domain-containing protein n=1 Tax=Oleidesulfovibrio sp. TaxID=2909707 RepID=UPI003A896626